MEQLGHSQVPGEGCTLFLSHQNSMFDLPQKLAISHIRDQDHEVRERAPDSMERLELFSSDYILFVGLDQQQKLRLKLIYL